MRFASRPRKGFSVKILTDSLIDGITTAGYDPISASSSPPYGPHIRPHKVRVWHAAGVNNLDEIRVIASEVDTQLIDIEQQVANLWKQHKQLLNDNFSAFRPAQVEDFNPVKVKQGLTKEEARAKLPQGKEAIKAKERGKRLAKITRHNIRRQCNDQPI